MTKHKGRANGGLARAKALTSAQRVEIAKKGATARWGVPSKLDKSLIPKRTKGTKSNWREITGQNKAAEPPNLPVQHGNAVLGTLRDQIALAVLAGLYSDIITAQKFAAHVMGKDMLLPEALTRIAYTQADEVLRLRAL